MLDDAPSVRVGDALIDGLSHEYLIGEVVPVRIGGKLIDQALGIGTNIGRIAHT